MDSHLFRTKSLDSYLTQNQIFIENKIMQTKWDIAAFFEKEEILIIRILDDFFLK